LDVTILIFGSGARISLFPNSGSCSHTLIQTVQCGELYADGSDTMLVAKPVVSQRHTDQKLFVLE
jgi:hypothetical protein